MKKNHPRGIKLVIHMMIFHMYGSLWSCKGGERREGDNDDSGL